MGEYDDHPIIKLIRLRGAQQIQADSIEDAAAVQHMSDSLYSKRKKHPLTFKRKHNETNAQLYARGKKWVGAEHKRQRRYLALADLSILLRSGKHVQNRTLQTHLTEAQYAAMQAAWEQQQRIRSYSSKKPTAIKDYEAELNRVQLQDIKAKDLALRGHAQGAAVIEELCRTQMQALLTSISTAAATDPELQQWIDRTIPADASTLNIEDMPRAITSSSKSSLVVRKSKSDIKLEAVLAAMQELTRRKR